jgi:RHS repeat-associated protein
MTAFPGVRLRRVALTLLMGLGLALAPAPASAQEQIEYYGLDALGSVRVIFDAPGNRVDRMDYSPFGENLKAAIKFPVEQSAQLAWDAESGQDYAQARNYSPGTGRFNAVDPVYAGLFNPQGWNRYTYGGNNPLRFIDPLGVCNMPAVTNTSSGVCATPAPAPMTDPTIRPVLASLTGLGSPNTEQKGPTDPVRSRPDHSWRSAPAWKRHNRGRARSPVVDRIWPRGTDVHRREPLTEDLKRSSHVRTVLKGIASAEDGNG